jgi:predicted DNA-binding transcriptional regulator AlpA
MKKRADDPRSKVPFAAKAAALKAAKAAALKAGRCSQKTCEEDDGEDDDSPRLRLISKPELLKIVGVSFVTIWSWMRQGTFPRSRVVHGKSMWLSTDVDAWVAALPRTKLKGDEDKEEAPRSAV